MKVFLLLTVLVIAVAREANACSKTHTVKPGDTCWDISQAYGLSLSDLFSFNLNINCNALQVGQIICLNSGSTNGGSGTSGGTCSQYYTVVSGDYCYLIADKNGISIDKFYTLNPGINCNSLQIGQVVCVNGNSGGSGTTAAPVTQPPSGGNLVSQSQFENAVTSCGYSKPRSDQYNNFISRAAPDGAITTKRELAMFLAQIMWESGGLIYLAELACLQNGCSGSYQTADDYPGQRYYGRGYIQLTWAYNYKAASQDLYSDLRLYTNPNQVATSDNIAWSVSFWFWKKNVHFQPGVAEGRFGVTTRAINGALECSGPYQDKARKRFDLYKKVLTAFGLNEAANESGCYN